MRGARQHDEKDTLAVVPWYWRDWRASTARAYFVSTKNWLGLACYRELLDAHWGESDCSLPGDDVELAALAGVGLEEWLTVKEIVVRWLDTTEDGRRRNPRAFREWKRARDNRSTARKRAKDAAKAMWDKKKAAQKSTCLEHAPSNAQAVHEQCPPSPTPSPSPTPTPNNNVTAVAPSARRTWLTPYAEAWTEAFGGTPVMGKLAKSLRPLDEKHGPGEVLSRWVRYLAETGAQFASAARFSETFGQWAVGSPGTALALRSSGSGLSAKAETRRGAMVAAITGGLKGDGTYGGSD